MKKLTLLFILLITTSLVVAQDFNQFDANGKRHGKWQKNYNNTEVLRYQGQFEHGKEVGTFKFYKNIDGKAILTATKEFNMEDDIAQVTFLTAYGKKISEGKMDGKNHVGKWLYYHNKSKQIMTEEFYNKKGKLEGLRKVYYLSGQIAEQANYKDGLLEGESKWFAENGLPIKMQTFKAGKFDGVFRTFNKEGKIAKEGHYKDDEKCCVWKRYKDGVLVEEKDLSKGK